MPADNFSNLKLLMSLNQTAALKEMQQFEGLAIRSVEKVNSAQKRSIKAVTTELKKQEKQVDKVGASVKKVGVGMLGAAAGAVAIKAGFDKVLAITQRVARIADVKQGFLNFGGSVQTIDKVNQALKGTVDQANLIRGLRSAKIAGLDETELVNMGKAAGFIAKQLGESKTAIFDLVSQGQLGEREFAALGSSMARVNQALAVAERNRGRALTESEQTAVKIRLALKLANDQSKQFTANTDQAGDKFAQARVQVQKVIDGIGKALLPDMLKFLQTVRDNLEDWKDIGKTIFNIAKAILDLPKNFAFVIKALVKFAQLRGKLIKATLLGRKQEAAEIKRMIQNTTLETLRAQQEKERAIKNGNRVMVTDTLQSIDSITKAQEDADKKRRTKARGTVSRAEQDRIQEQISLQQEGLQKIRDFSTQVLDLTSNIGGPISGVLSSLKDFTENTRIFGALFGQKFLNQVIGKSKEELALIAKRNKFTQSQMKAAELLRLSRNAGLADIKEIVINERIATQQLRAQIAPNQATATLVGLQVEKLTLQKDITNGLKVLDEARSALQLESNVHRRNALKLTIEQSSKLVQTRKERLLILGIQAKQARAQLDLQRAQSAVSSDKIRLDAAQQLLTVQQRLAELQGRDTTGLKISAAVLAQEQAQLNIRTKVLQLRAEEKRLTDGSLARGSQDFLLQQNKVKALQQEVNTLRQVADVQARIAQIQLRPDIANIAAKQAVQFGQNIQQALGGELSNIFQAIFAGDDIDAALAKVGLSILNILGDTLIAAGTQTLLIGLASLFNPYLGANPAAIALGGVMLAAGAAMKGGSAAASASLAQGGTGASASTPSRAPVREPSSPANAPQQSSQQVLINNTFVDAFTDQGARVANLARQFNRFGVNQGIRLDRDLLR